MQLTEQHIIKRGDPRFAALDAASFASKNLYNAALYQLRQAFFADRDMATLRPTRQAHAVP